jgi:sugar phosphate isomerase/epimerase
MQVVFFCPRWGSEHIAWDTFIDQVKQAGYKGVEWFPYSEEVDTKEIAGKLKENGLELAVVMTVMDEYDSIKQYIQLLYNQLTHHCLTARPLFISAQTGREYFNAVEITQCLQCCQKVSEETGIPIYQETHRNKWNYAAHVVLPILQQQPDVELTFDVSHWFCVSESYLEDQQEAVNMAIERARHIHARVGHTQGPQVLDPALPQYAEALEQHLIVWDRWIERMKASGAQSCTISPEFGPPPYLTQTGHNGPADAEQWRLNLWMKDLLHKRYNV